PPVVFSTAGRQNTWSQHSRRWQCLPPRCRMAHPRLWFVVLILMPAAALTPGQRGTTQEKAAKEAGDPRTVEQLAEQSRPAVAVITVTGRDGKQRGLGTG